MEIDSWISGYKVRSFPWIDGKSIYFSVSYYAPGQALSKPPVWEKVVYIVDNEAAKRVIKNFLNTVVENIARMEIPKGGHAVLEFK